MASRATIGPTGGSVESVSQPQGSTGTGAESGGSSVGAGGGQQQHRGAAGCSGAAGTQHQPDGSASRRPQPSTRDRPTRLLILSVYAAASATVRAGWQTFPHSGETLPYQADGAPAGQQPRSAGE